jgi:hypothetical protein
LAHPKAPPPPAPMDFNFTFSVPSLPLAPGRYAWRLTVGDSEHQTSFQVLSSPPR